MKLSILIASRNMSSKIDSCLESVLSSEADKSQYEVIIVDSSTDNSMEVFKKWQEKNANLKVMHFDYQIKCGTARNIAFKESKGEYIYIMDIDDCLYDKKTLRSMLESFDGKDIYFCPFISKSIQKLIARDVKTIQEIANGPVGVWSKAYKREFYVDQPDYMPEDVVPHYLVIDQCKTVGAFNFPVYVYDNAPENDSAISRTFDLLKKYPHNLLQLAFTPEIENVGLRQEFVEGVIHNIADMFSLRNKLKTPEVREAWAMKLKNEYQSFMTGFYIH